MGWLSSSSKRVSGGQRVALRLAQLGIKHLVSLPGSQVLPTWDALGAVGGLHLVVPRSERSGAFMAEGYGRAGGLPCALMSTLGPGVANELVGLRSALCSQAPVLCVAPCQPASKQSRLAQVFQGLDQARFFAGNCKRNWVVEDDRDDGIEQAIDLAFETCLAAPSGPVRVDIAFPLLFGRRSRRPSEPARRTFPAPSRATLELVVVVESPSEAEPESLERAGVGDLNEKAMLLSPGIGQVGFAVPFALGAKMARPQVAAVVLTTPQLLLAQLDSLAVAGLHGLAVRLVSTARSAAFVEQVASRFALPFASCAASTQESAPLVGLALEHRQCLTVFVQPDSCQSAQREDHHVDR